MAISQDPWAPPGFSAGGGKHRGAAGAERGGVWGGDIPLPAD